MKDGRARVHALKESELFARRLDRKLTGTVRHRHGGKGPAPPGVDRSLEAASGESRLPQIQIQENFSGRAEDQNLRKCAT